MSHKASANLLPKKEDFHGQSEGLERAKKGGGEVA